jgi:uncharacterized protein
MRAALWPLLLLLGGFAFAADPLPPKPADYVEDRAGLLSPSVRTELALKLAAFERATSSQVLVATFPSVPDDYAMEDFTQRTAEAWGVGQKAQDNGAVFFIFPKDHKMRIEVGYGLEGAIPDATAKAILDGTVTPAFRRGDFAGGITSGVDAILQAARGEYHGDGRTNADGKNKPDASGAILFVCFGAFLLIFAAKAISRRYSGGWDYSPRGTRNHRRSSGWEDGGWSRSWSGTWGGGDSGGGGGGSSGDSGGFSGGGGGFGGGGASGGW